MSTHPTLLRRPGFDRLRLAVEEHLHGRPSDYLVRQVGSVWVVTAKAQGVVVYSGPGPDEVFRSPAPF